MSFTKTNVNYASTYAKAMAGAYPYLSSFSEIWLSGNSGRYRPGMGKTMYIPSLTVKGAVNADRDSLTGSFSRNWNNAFTPVTLEMDREWDTLIDPMDMDETNAAATIAHITKVFNEQQKLPEMDAYLASKIHSFATVDTTALTSSNILSLWDEDLARMSDARVRRERLVAYMTPSVYKLVKQAAGVTRFVDVTSGGNVNRNVARLDGVAIREVPTYLMKSAYNFAEGWVPTANAAQMTMILVDPLAIAAPVKYETSMISAPTAQSRGKYLYYERYYYGAFMLPGREDGLIVHGEG